MKAKRAPQEGARQSSVDNAGQAESPEGAPGLKERIDGFLMYDFFFICFALAWLGVGAPPPAPPLPGVAVQSSTENTLVMDAWLALWPWVFQPAIGVLMLAALVSGGIGWAKENKIMK